MNLAKKIGFYEDRLRYLLDIFTVVYLVSIYIFAGGHEHWVQSYSNLIALFYIFFLSCYAYLHRENLLSVFAKLYVPFLVLCGVSFFWTWDRAYCLKMTLELCAMFVLAILMYNYLVTEEKTDLFLYGLYIGGICLMFGTILYFGIPEYFRGMLEGKRMGHILGNLNDEGVHSAYSFLIALYFCIYRKKYLNLIPAICLFVYAVGTGSRKVFAFLIMGIFMLFFLHEGKKYKIAAFAVTALIILMFMYLPIFNIVSSRTSSMVGYVSGTADSSTRKRINMIKYALEQWKKTPVFGIGLGSSHILLKQKMNVDTYSHNNYAELMLILGTVGLIFWYGHYLYPLKSIFRKAFGKNNLASLVLVFMVLGAAIHLGSVEYQERFQILLVMYFYCAMYKINHCPSEKY